MRATSPEASVPIKASAAQAAVETALQGNAAALALMGTEASGVMNRSLLEQEYPWLEIGRAYAAAFTAAGFIALQALGASVRLVSLAPELARLALRAAETLAHGVGLLLGTRQSGSIAQISAYVGTLEGQADTLLRGFLVAPHQGRTYGRQQDAAGRQSTERQILLALEAMTDRCEDIADALLAVANVRQEGRYAAHQPTSVMPGETDE